MTEAHRTIVVDSEGAVTWIRLNRPDARNGISLEMVDELRETFLELDADATVRALVVTGAPARDFCIGGDLSPTGQYNVAERPASLLDYRRAVRPFQELFRTYWELETPVVSAVNGTTAGAGWMLALLADLVVASDQARWTHVFARRGMIPHAGDPFFLPRVLPLHRINEAAMLSDTLSSETLASWGVVNRVVPPEDVERTARELAVRLAAGPTRSLGLMKKLYRTSLTSDMHTMFSEEADATAMITQTEDRLEGVRSLMEGRPPNFIGN